MMSRASFNGELIMDGRGQWTWHGHVEGVNLQNHMRSTEPRAATLEEWVREMLAALREFMPDDHHLLFRLPADDEADKEAEKKLQAALAVSEPFNPALVRERQRGWQPGQQRR